MLGFWCFLLVCALLIPLTMIFFGTRFLKKPPKKINSVYGYRTARSMRSQAAWDFAHRYCGKLWRVMGWTMLPLSLLAMLSALGQEADFTSYLGGAVAVIQCGIMFVPTLILTERALKRNFDEHGRPRSPDPKKASQGHHNPQFPEERRSSHV